MAAPALPTPTARKAAKINPITPPIREIATASPMIIPRIASFVKPNVFSTPDFLNSFTNRHRHGVAGNQKNRERNGRADAQQKNLILPRNETKLNVNCCSDSVLVGGESLNMRRLPSQFAAHLPGYRPEPPYVRIDTPPSRRGSASRT